MRIKRNRNDSCHAWIPLNYLLPQSSEWILDLGKQYKVDMSNRMACVTGRSSGFFFCVHEFLIARQIVFPDWSIG